MSQTLVEYRELIASLEKIRTSRRLNNKIRAGKEIVRDIFDIKAVQLTEASGI